MVSARRIWRGKGIDIDCATTHAQEATGKRLRQWEVGEEVHDDVMHGEVPRLVHICCDYRIGTSTYSGYAHSWFRMGRYSAHHHNLYTTSPNLPGIFRKSPLCLAPAGSPLQTQFRRITTPSITGRPVTGDAVTVVIKPIQVC